MKKTKKEKLFKAILGLVLILTFIVFGTMTAFAAGELPPGDTFVPDKGSFDAAKPIITVILFIAGIAAAIIMAIGILFVIGKDVYQIFIGKSSLEDKKKRFVGVGVGFVIIFLVLSGKWYDVLSFFWNSIIMKGFSLLK